MADGRKAVVSGKRKKERSIGMALRPAKEVIQEYAIKKALSVLEKPPEECLPRLINWARDLDADGHLERVIDTVEDAVYDAKGNWNRFIASLWSDIDTDVRMTFFYNFILNAAVTGPQRQRKISMEHNCNIPFAILMDPTSACNLRCTGCWAAQHSNPADMDYETMNSIVREGKGMGTYFYIFSGGEPLLRKDDILRLCAQHNDCTFLAFTNGTLIDSDFADDMLRVKNFIPAVSIDGYDIETDIRRGYGTYKKAINAMNILKDKKLLFGASLCYTSQNTEVVGSEEYIDYLIELGCKFAWYFSYMPVGPDAPTFMIASPEQREYMYRQLREFRRTKPLFTIDFLNDGEYVGGCIAGGRRYFHIDSSGNVKPCAFVNYSDSSIREKTLLQTLKSPLFMTYRENQPFNSNHLLSCPLMDNGGKLAEVVGEAGAYSTGCPAPEDVNDLCAKCSEAGMKWAPVAEAIWTEKQEKAV